MDIITTEDGSHSLQSRLTGESYHSIHGAIQESQHVFIRHGLEPIMRQRPQGPIRLLEVGLGTGLNVLLTLAARTHPIAIEYHAIECDPIDERVWSQLNFEEQIPGISGLLHRIHNSPWGQPMMLGHSFSLHKTHASLLDAPLPTLIDLLYFDAFSPDTQPELWTQDVFCRLYETMSPEGIWVTYCSKGMIKRRLREAGFTVHRLDGPPGKRHMLQAIKTMT